MTRAGVREILLFAIVVVVALLAWSIIAARRRARSVLDPGNSDYLSGWFDAMNPSLAGGPDGSAQS